MTFKFFRQYNKYIMVGGFTLLMVAFLIQPALNMLNPGPGARGAVGTVNGRKIMNADLQQARADIAVLDRILPGLIDLTEQAGPRDQAAHNARRNPLRWVLMLEEARGMGLSASQADVDEMIRTFGGKSAEEIVALISKQGEFTAPQLRQGLFDWAIVQQYQDLVRGEVPVSPIQRFRVFAMVFDQLSRGFDPNMFLRARDFLDSVRDQARVSQPLLERFMQDLGAKVKVSMVPVSAASKAGDIKDVPADMVAQLFKDYKDNLAGQGKPYPFGYRYPDRVKIEYMAIPAGELLKRVDADEAEALRYYESHLDEFTTQVPASQPAPTPRTATTLPATTQAAATQPMAESPMVTRTKSYAEVRERIRAQLTHKQASDLGWKIIKDAQAKLAQTQTKLVVDSQGYRTMPEGWAGRPLADVAAELQKDPQYKDLLIKVHSLAGWQDRKSLEDLPDIGKAQVTVGREHAPFADYALSAKEIVFPAGDSGKERKAAADNRLASTLRLQKGLVSVPLTASEIPFEGGDDSFYLFRITEAQATHAPASKDEEEVAPQLDKDARRLLAYQKLKADLPHWNDEAQHKSLEDLAKDQGLVTGVDHPDAFPRRQLLQGAMAAPDIIGVGRSESFVDKVFDLAENAGMIGGLAGLPTPALRSEALPVDAKLTVFLVRLEEYHAITFNDFLNQWQQRSPVINSQIGQTVVGDQAKADPFSLVNLAKRLHYVGSGLTKDDSSEE